MWRSFEGGVGCYWVGQRWVDTDEISGAICPPLPKKQRCRDEEQLQSEQWTTKLRRRGCTSQPAAACRQTELFKYLMTGARINTDERVEGGTPLGCLSLTNPPVFYSLATGTEEGQLKKMTGLQS